MILYLHKNASAGFAFEAYNTRSVSLFKSEMKGLQYLSCIAVVEVVYNNSTSDDQTSNLLIFGENVRHMNLFSSFDGHICNSVSRNKVSYDQTKRCRTDDNPEDNPHQQRFQSHFSKDFSGQAGTDQEQCHDQDLFGDEM